jgi:hypothetical protein
MADARLAVPVSGDEREQAMLDLVPRPAIRQLTKSQRWLWDVTIRPTRLRRWVARPGGRSSALSDQVLDCIAQSLNIANVDGLVALLRFRNDAKRRRHFLDDHFPPPQPVGKLGGNFDHTKAWPLKAVARNSVAAPPSASQKYMCPRPLKAAKVSRSGSLPVWYSGIWRKSRMTDSGWLPIATAPEEVSRNAPVLLLVHSIAVPAPDGATASYWLPVVGYRTKEVRW